MRARTPLVAAVVTVAALGLSACSVMGIRVESEGSTGIHVADTSGPTPAPTPTATEEPLPEGWSTETVDFGAECPVTVQVAVPPGFSVGSSIPTSLGYYPDDDDSPTAPRIRLNCSESWDNTAEETIANYERYVESDESVEVVADRKAAVGPGMYWFSEQNLGKDAIFANGVESRMYEASIGYASQGKIYDIKMATQAELADSEAVSLMQTAAENFAVEGDPLVPPSWVS